jgi:hypothetical protein
MIALVLACLTAAPTSVRIVETKPTLPKDFRADGTLVSVATFNDNDGSHVVYIERKAAKLGPELHVYGYVKGPSMAWAKQWQANDFVRDCEVDVSLDYRPGSLTVTDIDGDGIAEVTFAYTQSCSGDVSPKTMKLLMYEGTTKYAVRGETRVDTGGGHMVGGACELDPTLTSALPSFTTYLKDRWAKLLH